MKNKRVTVARTERGFEMRVFVDGRDNTALPTHWKQQSSILAMGNKIYAKGRQAVRRG